MEMHHYVVVVNVRGTSILQHADFHAALRNLPFALEFAACRLACFCYIYI